jgi:hypothetical protein
MGEWSHPDTTLDDAKRSLAETADVGANAVEFTPMWFFDSQNSTSMYPVGWKCKPVDGIPQKGCGRVGDPLRTTSDAELEEMIKESHASGLKVVLSPMLDPDYHHFRPFWTRDCDPNPWRGTIGTHWGSDCSEGSDWAKWHANYLAFLLHYAAMAGRLGVEGFVVTHELYIVNENCNAILENTVAALRKVCPECKFSTVVTRRANGDPRGMGPPWYGKLDLLATDYYPAMGVPHPDLPWQTYTDLREKYAAQIRGDMEQYGNLSAYFGDKKVLITEYGFQSHPFSYSVNAGPITGNNPGLLDLASCEIHDQCVNVDAQALGYDLSLNALYQTEWFAGVFVWLWLADPTDGGLSSDSFSPKGKPAAGVLAKYWTAD